MRNGPDRDESEPDAAHLGVPVARRRVLSRPGRRADLAPAACAGSRRLCQHLPSAV